MELPVSMESEDSESPAALTPGPKTAAVTAVMTAESCHTPDTVMEDRGVDLSFDTTTEAPRVRVKSELGEPVVMRTDKLVIPSENHHRERDQIKQECDNSQAVKQESQHILQSPGGRLKIFQNGRLLIELRGDGDRGRWMSAPSNKVYWPPGPPSSLTTASPGLLSSRLDSTASQHTTGSEASLDTGSVASQPSPWAASLPSPRPSADTAQPPPTSTRPHRVKPTPRRITNPGLEVPDKLFAVKPSLGQGNYRKKIRQYRRKCRNPAAEIKINVFTMRLEINGAGGDKPYQKRRRTRLDDKVRAARLVDLVNKLTSLRNRVHVPIAAWKQGRSDLGGLVRGPPSPAPVAPAHAPQGVRVKSELKMVTETCTASITTITQSPKVASKIKAETRVVTAETRHIPVKSLPITPTLGRVKQEPGPGDRDRFKLSATSIMSPELSRVKMEIGRESHNYLGMRDERDSGFLSPRKRLMRDARDFENGSPSAKHRRLSSEHRLSTDSLGSAGDRSSPYRAPHSPLRGAMSPAPAPHMGALSPKPKVSFSIDSIMGGGAGPTMPPRPLVTPTKMSHRGLPVHQPTPTRPRPPMSPARSPPPSREAPSTPQGPGPFSPFLGYSPGALHPLLANQDSRLMDPRLAQLAQLSAASSPYPNPTNLLHHYMAAAAAAQAQAAHAQAQAAQAAAASNSPLPGLLAASQAAAASLAAAGQHSAVWTPPVATTALSTPSPTPPPIPPPRQFASAPSPTPSSPFSRPLDSLPPTSPFSRPSDFLRPAPAAPATVTSASAKMPDIKYRGEPNRFSKLFGGNEDAPLNLSMKPTTL